MSPAVQTNAVDVEAVLRPEQLTAWITTQVPGARGPLVIHQLAGGSSNLTFRVRDDANDWVLRRPPLTGVLATAHDMAREHRVQSALAASEVPVAAQVAHCDDPSVIGAPFYLMAHVAGVVYDDVDAVAGLRDAEARAASIELVDVLVRLHAVDVEEVGLGDVGRPAGFLPRQLRRWRTQWEHSATEAVPAIDEVGRRLEDRLPPEGRHGIVHGDYSFNNTMFDLHDRARMVAVLDWELSTVGDPLCDLGTVLVYWGAVGARLWATRRPQAHRASAGFLDEDALTERYALTSGADLTHLGFYKALATYKLAVISQGAVLRMGGRDPERAATTGQLVTYLAETALAYCDD